MKSLLAQLKDLGDHLKYSTRNATNIDKALKSVYAILISITKQLNEQQQRGATVDAYSTKHIEPYNPGTRSVCGSEALRQSAIQQPIGEDEQD